MLLSEQVRILEDEEVLYTAGPFDDNNGPTWKTQATKQITLSETKIVYARLRTKFVSGDGAFRAHGRIRLDSTPLVTTGYIGNGDDITRDAFLVLGAGSYTFEFQGCITGSAGTYRLTDIKLATLNFPDKQRNNFNPGNVLCTAGQTTTVLNQNFTTPDTRKLAVGSIKKYVAIITVVAQGARRQSVLKNPGESNESGRFNWKIFIDDVQVSWTERREDRGGSDANDSYAQGAYGRYVAPLDYNTQYNLKLKVHNLYGSDQNCRAYVDIILCPWILADEDYEPVDLDFADGSTLYVVAEPLNENPTKYVRIGKVRFNSFGDTSDYYGLASGTGLVTFDYTFEMVEVVNSVLHVKGYGGCIGIIGVDTR